MAQNPFQDAFKSWENSFKAMTPKTPAFDFNDAFSTMQNNFETMVAAQREMAEGMQKVAKRQVEIAQNNTEEAMNLFKDIAASRDPKESASKQAEFAKNAFEKAANDTRELMEIATDSNNRAAEIIGKQMSENLSQANEAADKVSRAAKDAANQATQQAQKATNQATSNLKKATGTA